MGLGGGGGAACAALMAGTARASLISSHVFNRIGDKSIKSGRTAYGAGRTGQGVGLRRTVQGSGFKPTMITAMSLVSVEAIKEAASRIASIARRTPVLDVSDIAGRPLLLKLEAQQPGGAFKIRGAT